MQATHKNILYGPAVWWFWWLASLNVSAVPPLHSGFLCVTSPGLNYIFMGQVDEDGRGKIAPQHFVTAFKTKNQKGLSVLKNKQCWGGASQSVPAEAQLWVETIVKVSKRAQAQAKNTETLAQKKNLDIWKFPCLLTLNPHDKHFHSNKSCCFVLQPCSDLLSIQKRFS